MNFDLISFVIGILTGAVVTVALLLIWSFWDFIIGELLYKEIYSINERRRDDL